MKVSNINQKFINTTMIDSIVVDFCIFDDVIVYNAGLDDEWTEPTLNVELVAINNVPINSVTEYSLDEIEEIRQIVESKVND